MPTIPSPPAANTPQSHQKVLNGSRSSAAGGSGSRGLRLQQHGASNGLKHSKGRSGAEDTGHRVPRPASSAATREGPREKAPSKDGTVQRTAKEVEGLKDFVCEYPALPSTPSTRGREDERLCWTPVRDRLVLVTRKFLMTRSCEDLLS